VAPDLDKVLESIAPMPLLIWLDMIGPIKERYWVRLATASAIYRADTWVLQITDDGEIALRLKHAVIRDPQNRGPEFAPRVSDSPAVVLGSLKFVSVIGPHHGYYIPLPLAHHLYFERK
jgi:hypothetical protein